MTDLGDNGLLPYSYDPGLVAISVLIAVLASYVALNFAARLTTTCGRERFGLLLGGALAMGTGIWSMHFVAMLAFSLPIPMFYDVPTVVLSTWRRWWPPGLPSTSSAARRWASRVGSSAVF